MFLVKILLTKIIDCRAMSQAVSHWANVGSGQSMSHERWTEWHWYMIFSEYIGFPLSESFHHFSILIFESYTADAVL